jgi:hypothetical protein
MNVLLWAWRLFYAVLLLDGLLLMVLVAALLRR